ncbi:MAG TPA: protein phosphatase 2C domain-containing protein, partial [Solirubrobacterales bacterium]|nr:protein phosphatase 2C domain-containing protein [Solirubrobacterales bacterium]
VRRGEESPEAYLRAIARTANARIHHLAQADSSRSGMGTTLTAALVEDDEVSFAHVGDSRAYVFRDGELKLLTSDHSLVEELRRQGRLTDEQAEDHPQRSIITRALGPEREVEVDTMTYRARPGDIYLLCSDGLTTMVREDRIAATLAETESLDDAVSTLVREANEAGGRDNITVVAFRVEDAEREPETKEQPTLIGPAAEEAGLTAEQVAAAARERRREPVAAPAPSRASVRRRRLVAGAKVLAAIAVTVGLAFAAVYGVRQIYFLGSDGGGRLALYRGLPYDLPFDIALYSEVYAAPVQVTSIPADRRDSALDHTLRFHGDAVDLLKDLQSEAESSAGGKRRAARGPAGGRKSAAAGKRRAARGGRPGKGGGR